MIEVPAGGATPGSSGWWGRPYVELPFLAGHLVPEEVGKVYPAAQGWPSEIAERVRFACECGTPRTPRPEAGMCRLSPVEEPEALVVLREVASAQQLPPAVPLSYEWVELRNLIALRAVGPSLPGDDPLPPDDIAAIARLSLFGLDAFAKVEPSGRICCSRPADLSLTQLTMVEDQVVISYRIVPRPAPVLVGYEAARFFLVNGYSQVLAALRQGLDRLLCQVYYGLDLDAPDVGVRLPVRSGQRLSQFAPDRLLSGCPPLVRDFLDPSWAVLIPAQPERYWAQVAQGSIPIL